MQTALERFLERVVPEPNSGCWLWTGAASRQGYGSVSLNGKTEKAHRVSFFLHGRGNPGKLFVCHTCDTPLCVNPDHLFLGTNDDNQKDSVRKGRRPPTLGEKNPNARLTEQQARAIMSDRRPMKVIAQEYGVSYALVDAIRYGRLWSHLRAAE